jgi:hypothetical protein
VHVVTVFPWQSRTLWRSCEHEWAHAPPELALDMGTNAHMPPAHESGVQHSDVVVQGWSDWVHAAMPLDDELLDALGPEVETEVLPTNVPPWPLDVDVFPAPPVAEPPVAELPVVLPVPLVAPEPPLRFVEPPHAATMQRTAPSVIHRTAHRFMARAPHHTPAGGCNFPSSP